MEFARLLTSFESALALREPSGLGASPDLRSLVLRRSTGLIAEVAALLTSATANALAHGTERIDRIVLDQCDYRGPDERRALVEYSFPRVRSRGNSLRAGPAGRAVCGRCASSSWTPMSDASRKPMVPG